MVVSAAYGEHVPCQTGRGAYGDDPLSVVKRLLAAKESLPGDVCVACRRETTQKIVCLA